MTASLSTAAPQRIDVCAAIVTYHPQIDLLERVVAAVRSQVGRVQIFDNASTGEALEAYFERLREQGVEVFRSERNVGLGCAINHAARAARAAGFGQVLLMDQDSIVDADMVAVLMQHLQALREQGPVAAVGPQFRDERTGEVAPFVQIGFPMNRKLYGGPGQVVDCDFLITSGTLLPLDVLDTVGGMDEGLFIDNVDIEWSSRARHRGYRLYGICDARMRHRIGDLVQVSRLIPYRTVVHSPARLYYMMRNRVLLYRRAEVPRRWMAQDLPRLVLKFVGTALLLKPRLAYLRAMLRGLRDGVRGRDGAMPSEFG
ncbi:glycosyltransferase family 2 protein [Lysobacter sp. 1R34A]|uniref:glycosyltransferase family 2 protein n=1 Tax=Lysobacter sp. 1R34A TaxID=3445786 RepID=UPI003EF000AF